MASQNWLRFPDKNGKRTEKNDEDLLVFGYSCKLFRDDERAMYVDQGKHLIPWMGDDTLKIDRYDVRGYLHDLQKHEAKAEFWDVDYASGDARQIEEICERERYLALYNDVTEEDILHEEELKRLRAELAEDGAYHEIGFSYDNSEGPAEPQESVEDAEEQDDLEDRPFTLPPDFTVPDGMVLPETMKHHVIIEKTAVFTSQHGTQMEIVIKTKQSLNPQFEFLSFDNPLNPYYKYLVGCIKAGKYQPRPPKKDEDSDDDSGDHYLHPSLLGGKSHSPIKVPDLDVFRGDQESSYSMLVRNLKEKVHGSGDNSPSGRMEQAQYSDDLLQPPPLPPFMDSYWNQYLMDTPLPPGVEPVLLPSDQPPPPGDEYLYGYVPGTEPTFQAVPPPPDVQPIIDKMAEYVARSGEDFEMVVKSKSDKRFEFLHSEHEYHPYYLYKKRQHIHKKQKELDEKELLKKKVQEKLNALAKSAPLAPVSFSIKTKESEGKEKKRTFMTDEVDSDDENGRNRRNEGTADGQTAPQPYTIPPQTEEKLKKFKMEIEAKLEERLKDKLAAAAREKLSQHSKERQLQLERKRKAALFLNMLKNNPAAAASMRAAAAQKQSELRNVPFGPQPREVATGGSSSSPVPSRLGLDDSLRENGNSSSKLRSNSENKSKYEKRERPRLRSFRRSRSRSPDYKKSRTRHDYSRYRASRDSSKEKRQKTPPAAYAQSRRSRSRSPSPRRMQRSRSRDRYGRR